MQKNDVMTESRESVERERRDRNRYEMDSSEAARVLYKRILELEPESLAKKIMGYILVHEDDLEFSSLSRAPDIVIHNLIRKYKIYIAFLSNPSLSPPISPSINPSAISDHPLRLNPFSRSSSRHFSPPAPFHLPNLYWENQHSPHNRDFVPLGYSDSVPEDYVLQNHTQFMGLEDHLESVSTEISGFSSDNYIPESAFANLCLKSGQRSSSLPEFPVKTCHYFNKGFCKHGSNCRYFHGQPFPEIFGTNLNEFVNEDHFFLPGSLEKLELEITELLKSRRGHPVSIASLPMIYYEKYGRSLQAEGYLTESQRHGKAGYSLTKLLARLKNSIRLIDRPHGQHSVILAEDAPKYMDNRSERNDPGPIVSGSRQIYLTFPAESTFTEEDVSDYFNSFGPVQDVRIPCQQKRMFGFVTFVSADTVKVILSKGNPHYVCGARVLVKPYREKPKLFDRKYSEKLESPMYYNPRHIDMESELESRWESSRLLRKHIMEEQELALELERRRLAELQVARKPMANQSYFGYSVDDLKLSEAHADDYEFPSVEDFNYMLDVLNTGSTSEDNSKHTTTNCSDHESSQGLNLPDSPFASAIGSSISTAT